MAQREISHVELGLVERIGAEVEYELFRRKSDA
jgi:hypothetical protein